MHGRMLKTIADRKAKRSDPTNTMPLVEESTTHDNKFDPAAYRALMPDAVQALIDKQYVVTRMDIHDLGNGYEQIEAVRWRVKAQTPNSFLSDMTLSVQAVIAFTEGCLRQIESGEYEALGGMTVKDDPEGAQRVRLLRRRVTR